MNRLTLTKTMTDSNTGLISNIAEILEEDSSSNKSSINLANENADYKGQADVIIGVKTGSVINYIIFISISTISIVAIVYINQKRKKKI